MTRVIWSPRALDDLDAIEAYIAKDNPTAARRVIAKKLSSEPGESR